MKKRLQSVVIFGETGFTLVEVMVAMVIGMIGIIVMMQVFSAAEGQKRSTTGSGDAQSSGAMALYALQRDIRQSGYGFNALNALGCPLALGAPSNHTLSQLAPVMINPPVADVPAGDANTDTLLVAYGSSEGSPEGDAITALNGTKLGVQTPVNFANGHRVIAAPSSPTNGCALSLATVSAVAAPNVTVASSGAVEGGSLFNLGAAPKILAYAVRNGNLTVCDYIATDCGVACTATDGTCSASWVPIVNNIASLRVQYGHASTAVSGVDSWDQTTPPLSTPSQATLACLWARTSAARIAVLVRNSQVDKDVLTGIAPVWEGSADAPFDLTARANWQNYRYKVFETVIPVRNLPWMASC
jgi:type IV pilus assembly protein PilW